MDSLFLIILIIVGAIVLIVGVIPALLKLHESSMAPINGIIGNPDSAKTAAALLI